MAARGVLPSDGGLYDLQSYCFRHEPSNDPARMQLFRQREYVRIGNPDQVLAKLRAYQAEGIESFILSGYPHAAEADLFSRHVLPHIAHAPLTL